MSYQVSRNGQLYGPYTLEDLQRYLASGNVLPSDLAKSEDMPDWVPVSQLLAASGAAIPAAPIPPAYPASTIPYPDPPNLHWGLVLLLDIFTCTIFQVVWNIVLATWVKKIEPTSKAIVFYVVATILVFANLGTSFGNFYAAVNHLPIHPNYIGSLIGIIAWVVRLIARFSLRDDLERHYNGPEPLGLRVNPILTFFFGGIYFQYKLNQINEIRQSLRYRGAL
jgi:GYF domain 2